MTEAAVNEEQIELWNGLGGSAWVDAQETLDRMFAGFEPILAEAVPEGHSGRVLDVGCGTGATALAVARRLGPGGACVGLDVSEPMLALAQRRAAETGLPARFQHGDAQTHAFEADAFDAIVSRFGVMFFSDSVAAFANLRRAAKPGAPLRMAAWRHPKENGFMTAAVRAAAPHLPGRPSFDPDAPGQFAFADGDKVRAILRDAGWDRVSVEPIDVACRFSAVDLDLYLTRLGPLGRLAEDLDEDTKQRALAAAREGLAPYVEGDAVRYTAACWLMEARA
ncbi:class I SAM-dependent methyltransferase [Amorphus coralli]|uniref:class I SAM-dependent methyltransferase n=1 Tax=Amorphus coralli TaxID=340680 RepID=UPI00036EDD44|nr:class I SAM-dependent methyltransferase [Amorphus coralli]